jgi:iduronate 2-sulfatase
MQRSDLMSFVLLLLLAPAVTLGQEPETPRRNVLFLISDDLNTMLGCYGDPLAKTPNIDRLAARGVRFDRAYCTFPLCGPSRNSMLTGLYPDSTGIQANALIFRQTIPGQLSLSQAFRQHGYFAGRIGKLYHYNVPNSIGTNGHDDPGSWELELNPAGVDRLKEHPQITTLQPNQFGGTLSWYASPHPDPEHTDALMAKDADWVLERCARDRSRPFFLAVGFFRPHTPYVAPKNPWFDMYDVSAMPVVDGIEDDRKDIPAPALASGKAEQDRMSESQRREVRQAYLASVSFMDAQVGVVLDSLDRHGLTDSTVIVFTSDHGYHMGEHGLWQKMSLFEESSRVPLLIAAPGISSPGTVAAAPVSHVDLMPTLADLCGVTPPDNVQGQSLVPILQDVSTTGRGWALTEVTRGGGNRPNAPAPFRGYSLRTSRWRYTEWDEGRKGRELYDHETDPRELTNLAESADHAGIVADLSQQLQTAAADTRPPDGKIPEVQPGLWAPLLVDP